MVAAPLLPARLAVGDGADGSLDGLAEVRSTIVGIGSM
jgi:hypothetical protein